MKTNKESMRERFEKQFGYEEMDGWVANDITPFIEKEIALALKDKKTV